MVNLSTVFAGILFVGQFGTALYFGRLSFYFLPPTVLALPWMLTKIKRKRPADAAWLIPAAMIAYLVFFHFSYTVENHFATAYEALTARDFLDILVDALKGSGA